MEAHQLRRLKNTLDRFMAQLLADLPRCDQRHWAQAYIRGLLLDGDRKSIEPMARRLQAVDQAEGDYEQALQQLVNQSPWSAELVRQRLRRWRADPEKSCRTGCQSLLILDDTGFPKQGRHSVGVARQYSGTLGKVGNCQVAVTLQHVRQYERGRRGDVCCIDGQLYLPKSWTEDRLRMASSGVPRAVTYQPKWQIALAMLERAAADGLWGIVLADSLFGTVTAFRQGLAAQGWNWCVGIDSTLAVIDAHEDLGAVPPWTGQGRPPQRPARVAACQPGRSVRNWAIDHAADCRTVTWRQGSQGRMSSRFAAWRVRPAHRLSDGRAPQPPCWLLAQWLVDQDQPAKFFFSNLPANTPLRTLVRVAKSRWWVEQSYQQMKEELGLDHFEGRSWRGFYHHLTLVLLAAAFLSHLRGKGGDSPHG